MMETTVTAPNTSGRRPTADEMAFVRDRRVGRLATVRPDGSPVVVPFCYAVVNGEGGPVLVSPLDEKPK